MTSQDDSQPSQDSVMTVTNDRPEEILYFAYGSNLSTDQMRRRCPFSMAIGLGYLADWRWIINRRGYANIVPKHPVPKSRSPSASNSSSSSSSSEDGKGTRVGRAVDPASPAPSPGNGPVGEHDGVYGLLYLLSEQDEKALDVFEGVPKAYQKYQIDVLWTSDHRGRDTNQVVRALVYVNPTRRKEGQPKAEYIERMERGIEEAVGGWGLDPNYADTVMRRFWNG